MRALQFVPIKPKRSAPTCAYQKERPRPLDKAHGPARWLLYIIVDWKPDNCPMPLCEECKAQWEQWAEKDGDPILPLNVVVNPVRT